MCAWCGTPWMACCGDDVLAQGKEGSRRSAFFSFCNASLGVCSSNKSSREENI